MSEWLSRRRFLRQLTVFGGAVLLSPVLAADSEPVWVPVGPTGKFGSGGFVRVVLATPGQEVVYITHQAKGTYLGLSGRCTHKGCPVDWHGDHKRFFCPCHRGVYDALGKNIGGPPPRPLETLPTRVDEKGVLSVRKPAA